MSKHILIVDDEPDILTSVKIRINEKFPDFTISQAHNCDDAFFKLERNSPVIDLLILDLEYDEPKIRRLKKGFDLLQELKNKKIDVLTIIYTSSLNLMKIQPIIKNFNPEGIATKDKKYYKDLYFAIEKVLDGGIHYTHSINRQLRERAKLEYQLDETKMRIIENLPNINVDADWAETNVGLSSKTINKKLDELYIAFDVYNDKQLLLKLLRLGLIR